MKHYASFHQILLVGEGDFSFALCLARSFGSGSNIVATSLDSYDAVISKYKRGYSNVQKLQSYGATLIFGVDATKMKYSATDLANWRFDRIVYNFPHAGFHGKEDNPNLIRMHQDLVEGFFRNAAEMLRADGQVHVSHKTTTPFSDWKIVDLAFRNSLMLLDCVNFDIKDYPGYENKRGDSFKADDPFPLGECCTYIFVLNHPVMNNDMIQLNYSYIKPRSDVSNLGWIRFDICGVSMGERGLAGCGGVLIDDGSFRFVFSEPLGILKYEVAELRAFEVALCKFLTSRLWGKRSVLIRSNSYVAVSWVNNPSSRPMHLMEHFIEIDSMLNMAYDVRIEVIKREESYAAELWAKRAIHSGPFEAHL